VAGSLLGNAVRRVEDPELLIGAARYVDDLPAEGALHLAFVRSPHAHALVRSVDCSEARRAAGVVGAYSAADLPIGPFSPSVVQPKIRRTALASDKVRYAGEAVAMVAAVDRASALDALELIAVDYEPLAAVTHLDRALLADAPLLFDELGSNLAGGERDADGAGALEGAAVVVRARLENQRMAAAPMEPNAILVFPEGAGDGFALTFFVATQMPHRLRDAAARIFSLDPGEVRVVAPHVGGGFGGKTGLAAEYVAAIAAARLTGRPVKWIESREENLVGMNGRSQVQYAEMGFDADGGIVGLRLRVIGDAGAYGGFGGVLVMGPTRNMTQGVYRIPRVDVDAAAALTNTSPVGAFRGAGRPEAAAMVERMMDLGADALGVDPVELRRRNFIAKESFPYETVTGMLYDVGDYERPLDEALARSGYAQLRAEQEERRRRGDRLQLGIGVASYVEITAPGGASGGEYGEVEVLPDASATIRVGTTATGQGHATAFGMIVADRLGIPLAAVRFIQADTAEVPRGGGTVGSRSLQLGGAAVSDATDLVVTRGRELAAELLEADPADIVVSDDGQVGIAGVPARALDWGALAAAALERGEALKAVVDFTAPGPTFPFGTHVSVVEVDTETGSVQVLRHIAVDDAGRILNPLLVAGQQHGGLAQGIAQALWEHMVYDEQGAPLTSSFATYGIPSAAELCSFEVSNTETPTPYNPLGAKGIGESATIGSTPALQNAVVDALSPLGVRHIDLPLSPERVWRAIGAARAGDTDPWREPPPVFEALALRGGAGDDGH